MKNTITLNTNGKFEVDCVDMVDNGSNSILLNVITGENPESLKVYINNSLITTFSGLISASENLFLLPEDCYVADALLKVQYGSAYSIIFSFPSSNIGNMTVERVSDLSYSVKYSAGVKAMTENLDMGGYQIENVADPTNEGDAINLKYANSNFAKNKHSHSWDSVTDKPSTYPPSSHSHSWDSVTGKPSTYTPSSHSHSWDSVTGKPSKLVNLLSTTYTSTTNSNGNANTGIDHAKYIILSISAKDASGSETYLCNLYKSTAGGGRWYVNVCNVTSKSNVANTQFTFTIYYAAK